MADQLTPAQACLFKWGKEHAPDFAIAMGWIVIREYYRVKGTDADVAKWDAAVQKAWQDHLAGNDKTLDGLMAGLGAEPQAYLAGMGAVVNKIAMPGLDAKTCAVDWGQWACFCNWAAQQPPGQINTLPDKLPAGSAIPYKCDPKISGDSAYAGEWPKPTAGKNWTPWIIGGAVVAVLAVGGGFYAHKKGYLKLNPAVSYEREMGQLLWNHGYDPKHAKRLEAEGMGPMELEGRLKHKPGTVGSLEHSHGIQKRNDAWRGKAHKIIAELSRQSYDQSNRLPSGQLRKKHVPYSTPQMAQDLVECLNTHDEERAKAIFLSYEGLQATRDYGKRVD